MKLLINLAYRETDHIRKTLSPSIILSLYIVILGDICFGTVRLDISFLVVILLLVRIGVNQLMLLVRNSVIQLLLVQLLIRVRKSPIMGIRDMGLTSLGSRELQIYLVGRCSLRRPENNSMHKHSQNIQINNYPKVISESTHPVAIIRKYPCFRI